jgi:hypothetical protein
VTTHDNLAVADGPSVDACRWLGLFDELMLRIGARFFRVEPRRRARAFVLGLLAGLPRKNCWTIAGYAGDTTPDGIQHVLSRASWDADGVRDDVQDYVLGHLSDLGAVLVVDETGTGVLMVAIRVLGEHLPGACAPSEVHSLSSGMTWRRSS